MEKSIIQLSSYDTYKPSGVEWIGEIPAHWELKRLKHIAFINPQKGSAEFDKTSEEKVVFLPMEKVS